MSPRKQSVMFCGTLRCMAAWASGSSAQRLAAGRWALATCTVEAGSCETPAAAQSRRVGRGQSGLREGLRHVGQQGGRFGQRALWRGQRGHPPPG